MNDYGVVIQRAGLLELKDFSSAALIRSLPKMNQERLAFGSLSFLGGKFAVHRQGMCPTVFSNDANDELIFKHRGFVRIVMAYRSYSAEQVTNPAPPQANSTRHSTMFANR